MSNLDNTTFNDLLASARPTTTSTLHDERPDGHGPWGRDGIVDSLIEVTKGVHLVRSTDLASMTVIDSDHGHILIHPFSDPDLLHAALELLHHECGHVHVSATVDPEGRIEPDTEHLDRTDGAATRLIDGIPATFFTTPEGAEPTGLLLWLPRQRLVVASEEVTHRLHELSARFGGKPLNVGPWWRVVDALLDACAADVDVIVTQHHWPVWGNDRVLSLLTAQRDMLRYLHENSELTPSAP